MLNKNQSEGPGTGPGYQKLTSLYVTLCKLLLHQIVTDTLITEEPWCAG